MTSLVRLLSLLSALAATSYALSCTFCRSQISSTCSGRSMTCPSGYVCGSAYSDSNMVGEMRTTSLVRSCVPPSNCHVTGSLSVPQGQSRTVTSCCSEDDCTPAITSFPTKSYNPNGVMCRTCISADSTWCYTSDTMQCTGNEDMCLLMSTNTTGYLSSSTAIRGCGTKSMCDLGSMSHYFGGLSIDLKFICTNDGISVRKVVLTPAVVCLLLLKFFF